VQDPGLIPSTTEKAIASHEESKVSRIDKTIFVAFVLL
jgi:hypothetical protein